MRKDITRSSPALRRMLTFVTLTDLLSPNLTHVVLVPPSSLLAVTGLLMLEFLWVVAPDWPFGLVGRAVV